MLEVYSLAESNKWDEIVKSFNNYDVYYLSGYSKGFYIHKDGDPYLFYYTNDSIRAINVVMKRDISKDNHMHNKLKENVYYDFSTPYGYGGWIIEGNGSVEDLLSEYKEWCLNNNIISEVIRFHPLLNNQEKIRKEYDVLDLGYTVSMSLSSEEDVWNNLSSKNRNVIRKAIKNNVEIKHGLSKQELETFKDIYNQTMQRDNADDYYYFKDEFYKSIENDLKDNAVIFYALYDNKVIASSIILKANDKLSYHLSGSIKEYGSLAPSNLLLYEVAKWGVENGYKSFHLGGGVGSKQDRLYAFKKAFNKQYDYQYSIGRIIFNQKVYNELVELRKGENLRENYFPLYRA